MKKLEQALRLILHDDQGLREYKVINSKTKPEGYEEETKGTIFGFRSKENMKDSRGVVFTSVEGLLNSADELTHWTPNVFRYGTYADEHRSIVKGHSEDNLRQINTFVVDIDTKRLKNGYGNILLAAYDIGFMPTMILSTPRGYQAYFVLKEPAFVSAKSNFKVVEVAKKISRALRYSLAAEFKVDLGCNHLGIFRVPRKDNIVYFDEEAQYEFSRYIKWSQKQEELFKNQANVRFLSTAGRQVDEPWVELLLSQTRIKGAEGVIGRNNTIMTLALAHFSSCVEQEECELTLQEWNSKLSTPLDSKEVSKTIASAYVGKYRGAAKRYVRSLVKLYTNSSISDAELFDPSVNFYHVAKPRSERVRVHASERIQDLKDYLKDHTSLKKPYLKITHKRIKEELGIAESSFRGMKRKLKQDKDYSILIGRTSYEEGGTLVLALKSRVACALIYYIRAARERYQKLKDDLVAYLRMHPDDVDIMAMHDQESRGMESFVFFKETLRITDVNQP